MLEAPFCLYAAWFLIQIRHAGYSRLIPHQCKGCSGPLWRALPSPILRGLSRPRAAWLRGARAGPPRPAGEVGADAAGGGAKGLCRVGRAVAQLGPSPEPDKEISTIRRFR